MVTLRMKASGKPSGTPQGPASVTARLWEAFYCFSNISQAAGWSWGPGEQPTWQSGGGEKSLGLATWNLARVPAQYLSVKTSTVAPTYRAPVVSLTHHIHSLRSS